LAFTISDIQTKVVSMINEKPSDTDIVVWVNEAVALTDSRAWQTEKYTTFYDITADKPYTLPSDFVNTLRVVSIDPLLTTAQATFEAGTSEITQSPTSDTATLSQSTEFVHHGYYSAKLLNNAGTTDQTMYIDTSSTQATIAVDSLYAFSAKVMSNSAIGNWRVGVVWCDTDGTAMHEVDSDLESATTSETCLRVVSVSPSTAYYAYGKVELQGADTNQALYADGLCLYSVISESEDEYADYRIRRGKISFDDDDSYEMCYLAYPAILTATSDEIALHDAFQFPIVKMVCARQKGKMEWDGEQNQNNVWRAEFLDDMNRVLSTLELNNASFRQEFVW